MPTKIYFVEKSINFNSYSLDNHIISGAEKILINISNELAKHKNLVVKVFNNTLEDKNINNVYWHNLKNINKHESPDFLIAMSDANLLSLIKCKNKYLWSHSVQTFEKFIRKNQLLPFIKNKPIMILEGSYHFENRSFFTSFFGKKILPVAVDYDFIKSKVDENFLPQKNAIFTTRSDRNLKFLLDCWIKIFDKSNDSKLYINPPYELNEQEIKNNVKLRTKGNKLDLINDLMNSKVMLNPGHKGEVFCLAAEEARELCLPIVTMGYGALKERVEHGVTGYIAKNINEFIEYSVKLLNNDDLYFKIKKNLIKRRNSRSYLNVADDLLNILKINN